jgi:ABC-type transporter Mla MlaB component
MPGEFTANDAVTPAHAELRREPDRTVLALSGALVLETASAARRQVEDLLRTTPVALLRVDASGVDRGDMSGMSLLYELAEGRLTPGTRAELTGLKLEFRTLLAELPSPEAIERLETPPARRSIWEQVGAETVSVLRDRSRATPRLTVMAASPLCRLERETGVESATSTLARKVLPLGTLRDAWG